MKKHFTYFSFSLISLLFICCFNCTSEKPQQETVTNPEIMVDSAYQQPFRLAYHFSPEKNWMNDPNGLVYYQGEYHLFYQYNPEGVAHANMSWGHAVSKDLVYWEELPLAIGTGPGDEQIFSGSAVVDINNTSGLCEGSDCLVAIYTAHTDSLQTQHIAVSNDKGRTWTKYENNPVLDLHMKDFRDPKVFWYEKEKKWVMVVALPQQKMVSFYSSTNLTNWKKLSDFGPQGDASGIWECPDLFELPVENGGVNKWALLVSYNPETGSDMQYFIGNFDGKKFTNDNSDDLILKVDDGEDFYAAVTWNNSPDDRILGIGWLSNWKYAKQTPVTAWRGAQSVVRQFTLKEFPEGIRLVQNPVQELEKLRTAHQHFDNLTISEKSNAEELTISGTTLEIIAEFEYQADSITGLSDVVEFGVMVFKGQDQETIIGYDVASQSLVVDRTNSGDTAFNASFPVKEATLMPTDDYTVKMHIYVDQSSVEVFGNDGYKAMSFRIFPDPLKDQVELYVNGGAVAVRSLDIWKLKSIWEKTEIQATASATAE